MTTQRPVLTSARPTPLRKTSADEALVLLSVLHELARIGCDADLGILAGRLGWGVGRVVRVLAHLDRKGLALREEVRLTMLGLSFALSFAAHATEARRDAHHAA